MKKSAPTIFFERLQNLRSLACMVYDRALAAGVEPEEMMSTVGPVQEEYEKAVADGVENDLDGVAVAIESFEHAAEAQAKHAAEIMEKARDLRDTAAKLRTRLVESMDARGEETRKGTLYTAALVEGIGEGGKRRRQLVLR